MQELDNLKQEFLKVWSEDKVKEMSLDQYTNLERENSFCYWLESKTTDLGSIWGGSAYKFGIYRRSDIEKEVDAINRVTDGEYAWFKKYGESKEEAFDTVKSIIIDIIKFSKQNRLDKIDSLDLGFAYKWKIAFLYGEYNLVNIFKYEGVKYVAEELGFPKKKKAKTSELQQYLMEQKPSQEEYFTYAHRLWRLFDEHRKGIKGLTSQKQLFVNWLMKNRLSSDIAEDLEQLSDEVLSQGYFDKHIYECVELSDVYQLSFHAPIGDSWDNLYEHYYTFILTQIKDKTGINLFRNYALVTFSQSKEYDDFIKNNYWSGYTEISKNYLNTFSKGSQLAMYYREKKNPENIKVGAIGTVIDNPKNGIDLRVKWNTDFESFSVKINSAPGALKFFQIEPQKNNEQLQDIKSVFYKIKASNELIKQPLNQILFGAPGTGKTYFTKKMAVEIIDNLNYDEADREFILERYDDLYSIGQINFTTFHQSVSYEDFIEGIKPVLQEPEDEESLKNGNLEYEIKDGIFKRLCNSAKGISGKVETSQIIDFQNKRFFKMSLGGKQRLDIHQWSIENNLIFLGWGGENDFSHLASIKDWRDFREAFKEQFPKLIEDSRFVIQAVYSFQNMQIGDVVIISKGNKIIDAVGIIESDYFYDDSKEFDVFHFRKVRWLATNMDASPDLFINKGISQQSIYQFYNEDIKLESFVEYFNVPANDQDYKRYVLIIDEINRGNVSSIFGELITLIENDKRKGIKEINPEYIEVELPYSNKKFSVPDNLYIIGTMNSADRSVEALDTALRRRFAFIEMQPDPKILLTEHQSQAIIKHSDGAEINLASVLEAINQRIELLIDKDHQIGHSFFIKVKSFEELTLVFKDNIIPLLEEYFFGDFGKIGLVLGGEFIKQKSVSAKFPANFKYGEDGDTSSFSDKIIYEFTSVDSWTARTFTSIYE